MWSSLGPVPVTVTEKGLEADDFGRFNAAERTITVAPCEARSMEVTLMHEWLHVVFFDTGIKRVLSHELEEALCDGLATALVAAGLVFK